MRTFMVHDAVSMYVFSVREFVPPTEHPARTRSGWTLAGPLRALAVATRVTPGEEVGNASAPKPLRVPSCLFLLK